MHSCRELFILSPPLSTLLSGKIKTRGRRIQKAVLPEARDVTLTSNRRHPRRRWVGGGMPVGLKLEPALCKRERGVLKSAFAENKKTLLSIFKHTKHLQSIPSIFKAYQASSKHTYQELQLRWANKQRVFVPESNPSPISIE
ncbi:hypothetical protein CDAR_211451 [Caerostris darwini]|uniref:Uncharacterized protein n=1 Tax=Caerostris darwini TaxID=1538125 RepID=A0AAV4P4S0_9ARAC|nr:hypothetical protein CDAR_211451 [Caerostris darwini]